MSSRIQRDLKQILHPYLFVLKEGKTIGDNLLDYSRIMLHVHCHEVIKTPKGSQADVPMMPRRAEEVVAPAPDSDLSNRKIVPRPKEAAKK